MHTRRFTALLLGAWFGLVCAIGAVSLLSSRIANSLARPAAPGPDPAPLFRYAAAELIRALYDGFGLVELALLFALFCLLFLRNDSRPATILACLMLLTALASQFLLAPQVIAYGRMLDFRAAGDAAVEHARYANLQRMFGALALLRLACGGAVAAILLHRRRDVRNRRRGDQIDPVDHP